ncbi:hypothetical protein [Streptomyces sp. 891-h]|nr:hypothetical protein [Streptomyces sp. 891-h]UNZ21270.1 hypothetical protein HC362_33545 [Streptomyces sp. 891-h]
MLASRANRSAARFVDTLLWAATSVVVFGLVTRGMEEGTPHTLATGAA